MNTETIPDTASVMKRCPHCQKEILKGAKKCPYCQSDLRSWLSRHPILTILGVIVLIPMIMAAFSDSSSSSTPTPEKTPEEVAAEQKALETWKTTPAGKLCAKHIDWQKEECDKLVDNKIWVGMNYGMLTYLRGKPDSVNPSNYGGSTSYQYCWDDYNPSCFYDEDGDQRMDAFN